MNLDTVPLISADSHVEESSDFWAKNLPANLVDRLPAQLRPEADSAGTFAQRIGVEGTPEAKGLTDAVQLAGAGDLDALCEMTSDLERRFAVMRQDGVSGECIYPTSGLYVWNADDPEVVEAACRVYNDWIHDRLGSRSPRFRCAGMIPISSVEVAVAEVQRIADLGLGSAMLPLVGTPEYNHPQWKPLWRAIEETGLPITMHQGTGHDMFFYRGPGSAVANLVATQSMAPRVAALLATSGVLAEHPGLHFVFVETNASWVAWAMNTVDHYYDSFQQYEGWVRPILPERPGFYIRNQVHGTFQVDPVAVDCLERTGVAPLLWGSDFPHAEGTFPHSRKSVKEQLAGIPLADAERIAGKTAAELFHFEESVLTTPV